MAHVKAESATISFEFREQQYSAETLESLSLANLSVDEIKEHLNELPARIAYWNALLITVERSLVDLQDDYEFWSQQKYMDVDEGNPKRTEGWKRSRVMLDHSTEYRGWQKRLRDLRDVQAKLRLLISGYNNQVWTLREIARLTHAEISNLSTSPRGSGSLSDI